MALATIGLFGGTFDPPHIGHLRMALELKTQLRLDEMRLVPCHIPPHRDTPQASVEHRVAMLRAALQHCPELSVDTIELANPEPSYSVHTLRALRAQCGDNVSLCLAMGMDSLATLDSWYQWRELLSLAHLVVVARPGWTLPNGGELADYIAAHRAEPEVLSARPCGHIVIQELSGLAISSSGIRKLLNAGESPQFLLPDAVYHYIQQHHLYQSRQ